MKTSNSTISAELARRLLLVLIPFAVLAAFSPVLSAEFIQWDDDANFLNNPHFRGLTWPNLHWMFTTLYMSNYQPLSWLVTALGYSLWDMNPVGFHATSLCFHVLNAVLFYLLTARLLRLAAPASHDDVALPVAAAFAALLFALHPLRVESVAWLSGQHDLQAGTFYLGAVLCHLRACSDEARRRRWLLACAALFAAAMLSKVNGITLPIALLLLDVYPLRRLPGDPKQWFRPQHRRVWLEKIPLLVLAMGGGLVSLVARQATAALQPLSLGFRIQQAFYGLAFYLGTTMVPVRLTPFYPVPQDLRLPLATVLASVGLTLLLTAILLHLRRRWPGGLVAWTYYVVALLPALGLVSITILLVADRYTYLPCMAWAVLGGAAALAGLRRLGKRHRRLLSAGLAAVLLVLAGMSWRQSRLWHDSETLFRYVLALNPDIPEVHNNLGFVLVDQLKIDEGMAEYRKALAIKPDFVKAINNLALALLSQGRIEEGIEQCQKALALDPSYAFAHNNLGLALMYLDRPAEALPHFEKAVELVPEYVVARNNLGSALLALGRTDQAIAQFRKALALRPDYAAAATMLRAAEEQAAR
jgi:tetratricopeptide (TPR) repeat protein